MMENKVEIRRANKEDLPRLNELLCQVLKVHHEGRNDLFRANGKKYTDEQLEAIIKDDMTPIFVAVYEQQVVAYAFCKFQQYQNHNIMADIKTLYIDDLCVDEAMRGKHIGKELYAYVLAYAKQCGCYNVTLNVWACNESARKFYESVGLQVQKIGMETILQ